MAGQRKLFEEVGAETPKAQPAGGMIDRGRGGARGAIRLWLMLLFALVMAMIVVGGMTRLTDSGLSITEWKPVTGAMPPLDAAHWQEEFELYQQSPQYRLMNNQMTLDEFKSIYWWEWGHRQLGRVIGLVWALGFLGFLVTRKIPAGWTGRLLLLGALGGLQGAIGWWMVASGLVGEMVSVASYRLALHLGLAFVILGFIAWYAFALKRPERDLMQARRGREAKLFSMGTGLMHFAFLQILLGALVAGIDAGRSYTDWPLMAGGFFPPQPFDLQPVWRNFFEDPGLVQFMHRMAGYLLFVFGIVTWLRARKSANRDTRFRFNAVMAMMLVQVVLGIVTVLYMAQMHIAITHQIGAVVLWVLIIRARFGAQYPKAQSIRGTAA
ncbi:heme A synthase [Salipiger bermudensis]|uniref:heme A synthase n=1 Tax=Salipiger bermudensis TaxID=344736 RepID=UPI001CD3FB54|nr:heme A synthase [Salipiger bermudensis]MCA0960695.1 COX15/CtaA family protein [Salipiger bermudensis]